MTIHLGSTFFIVLLCIFLVYWFGMMLISFVINGIFGKSLSFKEHFFTGITFWL